jgi:hypothetical protein
LRPVSARRITPDFAGIAGKRQNPDLGGPDQRQAAGFRLGNLQLTAKSASVAVIVPVFTRRLCPVWPD